MAWYNNIFGGNRQLRRRLQSCTSLILAVTILPLRENPPLVMKKQYEDLEVVNRGVNMIVDDVAEIPTTVSRANRLLNGIVPKRN